MNEGKPFSISKRMVWESWLKVRANHGAAGVDEISVAAFEQDLKGNLYKSWNRMSSGSYLPPPVRLVEIPKGNGKMRPLGIPTVADRVAQMVAKMVLEPVVEPDFHPDSYGYRPGRSALDAVGKARERCFCMNWVIDLDIKGFFDNLDHDLVMKAVKHHTDLKWIHLYVERWLKAPLQLGDGTLKDRAAGTPQGGVISPLLANLFMHYAFDEWMRRHHASVPFERYADDVVIHCGHVGQARTVLESVRERLKDCGLELHPEKTRIVYCKNDRRPHTYELRSFDFLGYTFRPRTAKRKTGELFNGFLPAMSDKAAKAVRAIIRNWRLGRNWTIRTLEEIALFTNPVVRGWIAYYGRFYRSMCVRALEYLNLALVRWAMRKYKRFRGKWVAAYHWLGRIAAKHPSLFAQWEFGSRPTAGR